jgi:hypothetical protein
VAGYHVQLCAKIVAVVANCFQVHKSDRWLCTEEGAISGSAPRVLKGSGFVVYVLR